MDLIQVLGAAVGGGAIGGAVTVAGLSRWLGDVWLGRVLAREKAKYARELAQLEAGYAEKLEGYKDELERSKNLLQAHIDRSVFMTRAQFEAEFDAYKKIFEDLAVIRLAMPTMHPMLRVATENETKEDRLKGLDASLKGLTEAHNKTAKAVENLAPFYPQEIYEKLNKCLHVVRTEILNVQTGGEKTFSFEWSREGEKRVEAFLGAYHQVSEAVRQRIASLSVLPHAQIS